MFVNYWELGFTVFNFYIVVILMIGSKKEVLQHGGGHERKDPSLLQGSSHEQGRAGEGTVLCYYIIIYIIILYIT